MSEMNGNDEKSGHGAPPNSPVNPSNEPTEDPKEKPDKTVPEAEAHDSTGDIPICLDVVKEPTPPVDPPNDPKEEPDKAVPEAEDPPPGPSNGDGDDMCCNIFMDEILEQHQSK